ncbi:MAG: RsmD family RNA methyltransferase [Thermomicrobiales bacterium]
MRVISGSARGRKLKGPPSPATRPMADKIKGALFNSLGSLGIEPVAVLDLYAGTGNIGIEALSRGASRADFVDKGREQCAVIRDNLASTGFEAVARVHQTPVRSYISGARSTYDFVVVDPPYADPDIIETLELLGDSSLVQTGTIVVLGHWPRIELPERIGRLECLRNRCHGDSCFSIYEVNSDDEDGPATNPAEEQDQA